ncbi:MAG: hypothetical protein LJE61_15065 [Thiocapsa sp.]|nr:hypothetical protein [Thiocapsa sp.]MCG6896167.1 hypothetical protein [Thiocapsa sp.]MCG6986508.1 hypothetical protein [Thiocapsa sp.]
MEIIATSVAILILATAVLLIHYGHVRFPYDSPPREDGQTDPCEASIRDPQTPT